MRLTPNHDPPSPTPPVSSSAQLPYPLQPQCLPQAALHPQGRHPVILPITDSTAELLITVLLKVGAPHGPGWACTRCIRARMQTLYRGLGRSLLVFNRHAIVPSTCMHSVIISITSASRDACSHQCSHRVNLRNPNADPDTNVNPAGTNYSARPHPDSKPNLELTLTLT